MVAGTRGGIALALTSARIPRGPTGADRSDGDALDTVGGCLKDLSVKKRERCK